jgi:hypothetical protein
MIDLGQATEDERALAEQLRAAIEKAEPDGKEKS